MLKNLYIHLQTLIRGKLWLRVLIGLVLGVIFGTIISPNIGLIPEQIALDISDWLALPGNIFIKMVKLIMIPLVVSSIITGIISSESLDQLKKMGLRVTLYFVFTTSVSILIGVGLSFLVKPGSFVNSEAVLKSVEGEKAENIATEMLNFDSIPQFLSSMLPNNPLSAMAQGEMLGIIISTIIFGIAIFTLQAKSQKLIVEIMQAIQEVCMIIVEWAMKLAPIAVFGLMAQMAVKTGSEVLMSILAYVITVIIGLLLLLVFYCIIIVLLAQKNPFWFLSQIKEVQLLAFSTSSSAAVMPFSMKTAEEKLGVQPSVYQFIIPIGATINMDGTALYQGCAAVFLAQLFGVDLSFASLGLMVVTVTLASIGTPAIPGVGIIILATVLQNAGIPATGIAIILGVDRILDMCRTTLNVTGDLTACTVFNRWMKEKAFS